MRETRNHALDGLRGLAALSVALGHCALFAGGMSLWATTFHDFPGLSRSAVVLRLMSAVFPSDAAVMVFFVLSGHVLWESFRRKRLRLLPDFGDYACKRLFRLLPLTIVTTIPIGFLMAGSAQSLAENMLLLSHNLNPVMWSLQVEIVVSLGLFVLWGITLGNVRKMLAALAVAVAVIPFCRGNPYVVFLPAFILGALISSVPNELWHRRFLLPVGLAALLLTNIFLGHGGATRCFEIVGATVLVGAVASGRLACLNWRVPVFLGAISYPFYLIHPMFLDETSIQIAPLGLGMFGSLVAAAVLSITAALPFAWLLHVGIEMPVLNGRPRIPALRRRFRRVGAAAGERRSATELPPVRPQSVERRPAAG